MEKYKTMGEPWRMFGNIYWIILFRMEGGEDLGGAGFDFKTSKIKSLDNKILLLRNNDATAGKPYTDALMQSCGSESGAGSGNFSPDPDTDPIGTLTM